MQIDTFYISTRTPISCRVYLDAWEGENILRIGKEKIYCVTTNIINIQTKQSAFLSVRGLQSEGDDTLYQPLLDPTYII